MRTLGQPFIYGQINADSINSGKMKRKISKATFLIASDYIYTICSYNNEVLLFLFKIISEIIILMIVNN